LGLNSGLFGGYLVRLSRFEELDTDSVKENARRPPPGVSLFGEELVPKLGSWGEPLKRAGPNGGVGLRGRGRTLITPEIPAFHESPGLARFSDPRQLALAKCRRMGNLRGHFSFFSENEEITPASIKQ